MRSFKYFTYGVLAVTLLAGTMEAFAGELDLRWSVSIGSKHFNTDVDYNEFNPGVGYEARLDADSKVYAVGGMYYNSESTTSMYGGVGHEGIQVHPDVQLGAEVGLVTGYSGGFILPVVAGVVRVSDHLKMLVLPPTPVSPLTVGVQVVF